MIKKIGIHLGILVVSLVIAYGLGELLVYSLYHDRLVLFPRYVTDATYGSFKIRRNVPNVHYRHKSSDGHWDFFINGQGFRSKKNFTYEKPAGTIRIITLGDSFTIGFEVQQEETYSAVLENYLRGKGYPAEVINTGVSGFSTAEEYIFLREEGLKYHPDIVVLGFYENDFLDNVRSDLFRLIDNRLVLHNREYLPAIKTRNFLNSFFLYRWLGEHSYLHNYINNTLTALLKEKEEKKKQGEKKIFSSQGEEDYDRNLALALIRQVYLLLKDQNIFFVLLDIPNKNLKPSILPVFDQASQPLCDHYLNATPILKEYQGLTVLYPKHGHNHWAAVSHLLVGKRLGEIIEKQIVQLKKK